MLRLTISGSHQRRKDVHRQGSAFPELGEDKPCWRTGTVRLASRRIPVGIGQKVFDLQLGRLPLCTGKAMCNLNQDLGQTCDRQSAQICFGLLAVAELPQHPSNRGYWGAQEPLSWEVWA